MFTNINTYLKAYLYYQTVSNHMNKNLILESYCTIFKLILLSYKPEGTKVSIYNNSIQYHEPSLIQGFIRIWSGDCREDLHNLYNPIIKSLEYSDYSNHSHIYLLKKCIEGIKLLLKVYDDNTIINHTLLLYINIINKYIELNIVDKSLDKKQSPLIDGLKDIWNNDEITLVYNMLLHIDNIKADNERKLYIKSIEEIITFKEEKVYNYIQKNSTTYN